MLAILRNTTQGELNARQGKWRTGFGLTTDPNGLRLGIIGMGAIGSDISRKARVFGMEVVYNNRHRLSDEGALHYACCGSINRPLTYLVFQMKRRQKLRMLILTSSFARPMLYPSTVL